MKTWLYYGHIKYHTQDTDDGADGTVIPVYYFIDSIFGRPADGYWMVLE